MVFLNSLCQMLLFDGGVYLSGLNTGMPQKKLNTSKIRSIFQQGLWQSHGEIDEGF